MIVSFNWLVTNENGWPRFAGQEVLARNLLEARSDAV